MDSPWYKNISKRKRQTLHAIGVGSVFFVCLYFLNTFFGVSVCIINNILDIECSGCGLTRAFIAVLHFDFRKATALHVLSVPIFFGIVVYCFFCMIDIVFQKEFITKIERQLGKKYMLVLYTVILLCSFFWNRV